jgi:hypothetical protein
MSVNSANPTHQPQEVHAHPPGCALPRLSPWDVQPTWPSICRNWRSLTGDSPGLCCFPDTPLSPAQYSEAVERMKAFGSGLRALGMTPQPDIKDFNQAVRRLSPGLPPPHPPPSACLPSVVHPRAPKTSLECVGHHCICRTQPACTRVVFRPFGSSQHPSLSSPKTDEGRVMG